MGIYICSLNSAVHVIMYSYYYLSSYKSFRNRLKIVKPFITIIQLVQLSFILAHSFVAINCNISKLFYAQVANGLILIGFFVKFYIDSYSSKRQKAL